MTDEIRRYLSQDKRVRVQALHLDHAWQTGLAHQEYPDSVRNLLGQLVAASVLLATNIKFDGALVLQLQGNGPIALIVVECNTELAIRATVTIREGHEVPSEGTLQSLLNADGSGRFIVVLDPQKKESGMQPYQGVVPLEGDTVAQVLENYMRNSEQLDTRLWLAADASHTGGVLLQRMPGQGGEPNVAKVEDDHETWSRMTQLAGTLKPEELLTLPPAELVHRLFWQEELIAFDPQAIHWHCPCTRERVANMLRSLGRDEIEAILSEHEKIEITCNFCGKPYEFDAVDAAGLFVDTAATPDQSDNKLH